MLVLLTGGTGFVGAHTAAAMVRAGHRVRVLSRGGTPVEAALAPLQVDLNAVETAIGDVTDTGAVERAVRGVDAVVHAASIYSFDSRMHAATRQTNVRSTEVVLDAARRAGVERTIYISTFGAMLPSRSGLVTVDSPPGRPRETYLASKAAAERVARRHQAEGAPVIITYPPALLGPHDPKLGDQNARLRNMLRGLMPMWPLGGFPLGDVRDTAELHAALLTAPRGEGDRYFGPGRYVSTRDYVRATRQATGKALPTVYLPARAMLPFALLVTLVQHVWPWHIPAEYGACYVCACAARADDRPSLGIAPRPLVETITDTVAWLHRARLLTASQAGTAVTAATAATPLAR